MNESNLQFIWLFKGNYEANKRCVPDFFIMNCFLLYWFNYFTVQQKYHLVQLNCTNDWYLKNFQHAQHPPSIGKQWPLMNEDFSLSKNIIGSLTSFSSPNRYNGIRLFIVCALAGSLQFGMLILVIITVGFTLLQRMLRGANSSAKERVN